MDIRKIVTFVLVLIIIALGVSAFYIYQKNKTAQTATNKTPHTQAGNNSATTTEGKLIFGIKDKAADMRTIASVVISINKAEIHSQANGWVTISDKAGDYDLLALKQSGATSILAEINVAPGTYDQMRITASRVLVTQNGAQSEAKLPSGELKIMGNLIVEVGKTSTVTFDFATDKSLHTTGTGKFIFAPVLKIDIQGSANSTINAGMNVDGQMQNNFMLNADIQLNEIGGVIKVGTLDEKDKTIKINSDAAISIVLGGKYLDSATSVAFVVQNGKKQWVVSGWKNLLITSVYVDAMTGAIINY